MTLVRYRMRHRLIRLIELVDAGQRQPLDVRQVRVECVKAAAKTFRELETLLGESK